MSKHRPTLLGRIAITLAVLIIGIPAAFFLIAGSWGLVLIPVVVAYYAYPWFFLNRLLWGRRLEKRLCKDESINFWS